MIMQYAPKREEASRISIEKAIIRRCYSPSTFINKDDLTIQEIANYESTRSPPLTTYQQLKAIKGIEVITCDGDDMKIYIFGWRVRGWR